MRRKKGRQCKSGCKRLLCLSACSGRKHAAPSLSGPDESAGNLGKLPDNWGARTTNEIHVDQKPTSGYFGHKKSLTPLPKASGHDSTPVMNHHTGKQQTAV